MLVISFCAKSARRNLVTAARERRPDAYYLLHPYIGEVHRAFKRLGLAVLEQSFGAGS